MQTLLFVYNALPFLAWILVGSIIYLNLGWRIGEWTLGLDEDNQVFMYISPAKLLLAPASMVYFMLRPAHDEEGVERWDTSFKIVMTFFGLPLMILGVLAIAIGVVLWLITFGRLKAWNLLN